VRDRVANLEYGLSGPQGALLQGLVAVVLISEKLNFYQQFV
jgi:hypothetical protein